MEDVLYTIITSTNSITEYKIMLNSSFHSKHKHHVHVVGDLQKYESIYHISRFDDQLLDKTSSPSRIGARSECIEYEECKNSLPERKHADFESHYTTSHDQRGRCDDVIIYNNCVYFFELKNNETLPDCHIFQQLQSSKEILYQGKINLLGIAHKDIQTYDHKFILCMVKGVINYVSKALSDIKPDLSQTVTKILDDEDENLTTNFMCRNDNIIITCEDQINLNNLT